MTKIRCIIIDDEPIAIAYLEKYVDLMPQLHLVDTFNDPRNAYPLISEGNVDLIFLDIQMPEITGLDFIRTLTEKPQIILTTAYSEFALEGFDLNVLDYLLKPVSFERFSQAVHKLITVNENGGNNKRTKDDFIFLRSGYKSFKINIEDISYIEGSKEYIKFHTKEGKVFLKNERMKVIEEQFSDFNFIRVHKSFLVNIKHIDTVFGNTIEIGEAKIPIGRAYKEIVNQIVGK